MRRIRIIPLLAAAGAAWLTLALAGCGGGGGGTSADITIAVTPSTATLSVGETQTLTATVANTTRTGVTWSVQEGSTGGTITSAGVYTAPSTAGTYHVIAKSAADTSKTATAEITVESGTSTVTVE